MNKQDIRDIQQRFTAADADRVVAETISDCLNFGDYIKTDKDHSYDLLHYATSMGNPRARILTNPIRPLNLVTAVARFTWLIAGNNRAHDIAYYEPKVLGFSDDGITVPGSDYGMRLFQPRPGLNQIKGVCERLKANPLTRQAAAVVWQPEDAVRESKDIPCTFGMFFHVRAGCPWGHIGQTESMTRVLHMATNMRSNNAFRILPFNLFEFTMLHELIAAETGIELGQYTHWAASMHVYDNEHEYPATQAFPHSPSESIVMPLMPGRNWRDSPLQQAETLVRLEARLRHATTANDIRRIHKDADQLNPYWQGLFGVLLAWTIARHQADITSDVYALMPDQWRDIVQVNCQKAYEH